MTHHARSRILNQEPNFPFGDSSGILEDARSAVAGVTKATSLDDLKVLAYALHVGATSEEDIRGRVTGEDGARLLADSLSALPAIPKKDVASSLPSFYAGYVGRLRGRTVDEGWALAVLEMLLVCDPAELRPLFEADDPSFFTIRWMLGMVWDPVAMQQAIDVWARSTMTRFSSMRPQCYSGARSKPGWEGVENSPRSKTSTRSPESSYAATPYREWRRGAGTRNGTKSDPPDSRRSSKHCERP